MFQAARFRFQSWKVRMKSTTEKARCTMCPISRRIPTRFASPLWQEAENKKKVQGKERQVRRSRCFPVGFVSSVSYYNVLRVSLVQI